MSKLIPILVLALVLYRCSNSVTKSNYDQEYNIPLNGLMVHYPFSGNANDSSGHNTHGEVFGPSLTKDRNNEDSSAYYFDGVDDFIRVKNSPILDLTNSITISVWAKGVGTGTRNEVSICGLVSKGPVEPYGLGLDDGDRVLFRIVSTNNWYEVLKTNFSIDSTQWNHYIGVFEAGKSVRMYINGKEIFNNNSSIPQSIDPSDYDLWIGARAHSETPYFPKYYFKGIIDEVRIYNRALSLKEIKSLFYLYN